MSTASRKRKLGDDAEKTKFYAVRAGKNPGVYRTWKECQDNTVGWKGAVYKAFEAEKDARDFCAGKVVKSNKPGVPPKFYGVASGRVPGVYEEWTEAQLQIKDWKGPKYKKFATRAEAEEFVRTGGTSSGAGAKKSEARGVKASQDKVAMDEPVAEIKTATEVKNEIEEPTAKKAKKSSTSSEFSFCSTSKGKVMKVWTDGSALGNGNSGARAGYGVWFGDGHKWNISERLAGDPQTNNRAELTAILVALHKIPIDHEVLIYTDSNYSINCIEKWYTSWVKSGWKTSLGKMVENQDLIMKVRDIYDQRQEHHGHKFATTFQWVKGHNGHEGNEGADTLANAGARKDPVPVS